MNISELARQVRLSTKELRALFPEMGFDIGGRAIKVDSKVAQEVIKILSNQSQREKLLNSLKNSEEAEEENTEEKAKEDTEAGESKNEIKLGQEIIVKDLASAMNIDVTKLVVELMRQGVMASLNDKIDYETASIVVEDFGFKASLSLDEREGDHKIQDISEVIGEKNESFTSRPPVVVVMGHVDHGKTRLLDAVRETNIIDQESGGITQHIGAYQVEVPTEKKSVKQKITFIDTPGHEAFSMMRSRGARVADLAILVVAADDGVQPQTIEAASHIKKARLPFIVAINKIDKDGANVDNVKTGLSEIGITADDWGGDVMMIPISAKQGTNIDSLLESLLLLYEVEKENITADEQGIVVGSIIESHIDKGSGPVATVLVRNGNLKLGQNVLVGDIPGKVRSMTDWQGHGVSSAMPATPVAVLGLKSAPRVGDLLKGVSNEEHKKTSRQHKKKTSAASIKDKIISETDGEKFNLIIKADVLGSLEALQESLIKLNSHDISLNIISQGLGYITEADVLAAEAADAYVLGFNSKPTAEAEELARSKDVTLKSFEVIYDYLDFVAAEASKKLSPEITRVDLGKFKIVKIFRQEKNSFIAGGKVVSGEIENKTKVDLYRGKQKIGQGEIEELQSGKEEVNQVVEGQEAGLKLVGLSELEPGDHLINFKEESKERTIEL